MKIYLASALCLLLAGCNVPTPFGSQPAAQGIATDCAAAQAAIAVVQTDATVLSSSKVATDAQTAQTLLSADCAAASAAVAASPTALAKIEPKLRSDIRRIQALGVKLPEWRW